MNKTTANYKDKTMMLLTKVGIVLAFITKGSTLYTARKTVIKIGNEIVEFLLEFANHQLPAKLPPHTTDV